MNYKQIRDEFLQKQNEYLNRIPSGSYFEVLYEATKYAETEIKKKYNLTSKELKTILENRNGRWT